MRTMQRVITVIGLLAVVVSAGCAGMGGGSEQTSKIRIRALFDGADTIHIQGGKLWMKHYAYELPGRWHGGNAPVYVNDNEWRPDWLGNDSSIYEEIAPEKLPSKEIEVDLKFASSTWGRVDVWQQPKKENDYTLIVTVDDRGPKGAHWYTIDLDWETETAKE